MAGCRAGCALRTRPPPIPSPEDGRRSGWRGSEWRDTFFGSRARCIGAGAAMAANAEDFAPLCPRVIRGHFLISASSDAGNAAGLVYFIFDLLHRDGED